MSCPPQLCPMHDPSASYWSPQRCKCQLVLIKHQVMTSERSCVADLGHCPAQTVIVVTPVPEGLPCLVWCVRAMLQCFHISLLSMSKRHRLCHGSFALQLLRCRVCRL